MVIDGKSIHLHGNNILEDDGHKHFFFDDGHKHWV